MKAMCFKCLPQCIIDCFGKHVVTLEAKSKSRWLDKVVAQDPSIEVQLDSALIEKSDSFGPRDITCTRLSSAQLLFQ